MPRTLEPLAPDTGVANPDEFAKWMESRPPSVRNLTSEFPMGSVVIGPNMDEWYIIGYTEGDEIIISPLWLAPDYEAAMNARSRIHASHLRDQPIMLKRYLQ